MFNQRRGSWKGKIFYITLFALFIFGIWINAPLEKKVPKEISTDTNYKTTTDSGIDHKNNSRSDIMGNIIDNSRSTTSSVSVPGKDIVKSPVKKGYYLVKEENGVIVIYHYDEEGKETFVRETSIAFSLLSTSDQELFKKGIVKNTEEELNDLLQDFES